MGLGESEFFSYNLAMSLVISWVARLRRFNLIEHFGASVALILGLISGFSPEILAQTTALAEDISQKYRLYPGLTQSQSDLAHEGLKQGYSGDFAGALKKYRAMESMEEHDSLPPLSQLLIVATGVLILERGDYSDSLDAEHIASSITEASEQGRYLCKRELKKNKNHPTYSLILGGIQGFLATRKIHTQPTRALQDGFQAMRLLERTLEQDPRLKDATMGQGIFDCTASNAPLVVRGALKLLGRSSNFKQGLRSLRMSAYSGQYTSVASQLYLIQFLSPYEDESRQEKRVLFKSLRSAFPSNPMYAFYENDEALCFYPDSFWTKPPSRWQTTLKNFKPMDFAGQRYLQLLKLQYSLFRTDLDEPHSSEEPLALREWNFYPIFIEGLRHKREFEDSLRTRDPSIVPEEWMAAYRDSTLKLISQSEFTPTAKRYYSWRVRDALKLRKRSPSLYAEPSSAN